jgi:hypothetical protein
VFSVEVVSVLSGHNWDSGNFSLSEGTNGTVVFDMCNLTCEVCSQATGKNITDSIWSTELGDNFLFTFRLYYYGLEGRVLEDEKTVSLVAITDFIAFSQDVCRIEKGQSGTLGLNITNLVDEPVSDVNISLTGSNVFEFSPNATSLTEIPGSSTEAAALEVKVPSNTETGSYNVTLRIEYTDFSGETHEETETASISVEPASAGPELGTSVIYLITAAAVVVALGGLLFVHRKRMSKKKEIQTRSSKVS